jgi:hypothetical protein
MYTADEHDKWLQDCDLAIIFDVGDFKRLRGIKTPLNRLTLIP